MTSVLEIHPEVREALDARRPVVALESTLIAHGLPPARRLDAARAIEGAIRSEGAIPATIAILGGRFCVGLGAEALERVATGALGKASLRDLAPAIALRADFATTVASTMAIAARARIRLFATGGIGGVHREVLETFDESADLVALARYPVGVVCAGAKSVLDLPRTLERLETLGVPVIGYRTDELPAFYCAESGLSLRLRADDPADVARILEARFEVLGEGGVLIAQPPPKDAAQDPSRVRALIDEALARAKEQGVRGADVTPLLLRILDESSGGSVVDTNLALVLENARLAARIARALAHISSA
jgi:pseudouridylate synthase